VAKYLAERVQGNVRELEGVLTRLKVEIQMDGCPADLALARRVLGANGHGAGARAIRMDDILDAVTRRFGVRVSDLQSRRRTQSIVLPRQVVMYLARELTNLSLEEIGRYLGGRDHTTVIYALGKIQDRLEVDGDFAAQIAHLQREIRSLAG
jgi:chromosomal replication initiator protein